MLSLTVEVVSTKDIVSYEVEEVPQMVLYEYSCMTTHLTLAALIDRYSLVVGLERAL